MEEVIAFIQRNCRSCHIHQKLAESFAEEKRIPLRLLDIDDEENLDEVLSAIRNYSVDKIPTVLISDKNGKITKLFG